MMEPKLKNVKVGDRLIRLMGGKLKLPVLVHKIYGAVITVKPDEPPSESKEKVRRMAEVMGKHLTPAMLEQVPDWTFSMNTGGEIDIDLGWDGINTGSILIKPEENDSRPTEP